MTSDLLPGLKRAREIFRNNRWLSENLAALDDAIKAEEAKMAYQPTADELRAQTPGITDIMRGVPECVFKPGGQYKTRDGREARVYATDHAPPYCVLGAIKGAENWSLQAWDALGPALCNIESKHDLMPPTRKVTEQDAAEFKAKMDGLRQSFNTGFWLAPEGSVPTAINAIADLAERLHELEKRLTK